MLLGKVGRRRGSRRSARVARGLAVLCLLGSFVQGCILHYGTYKELGRYGGYTIVGDPPNVAFASELSDERFAEALPLLKKVRVQDLDLNSTDVSDASVPRIAELKTLKSLNVVGTRLTADALQQLRVLPRLKYLTVWSEQFNDADVARLEASLPGVDVERDDILMDHDRARANLQKLKAGPPSASRPDGTPR